MATTLEFDEDGTALIPCALEGLGEVERGIVRRWFITPPVFDPWDEAPNDGRHRLWGVWSAEPAARLPVRSEILGYARDVEISRTGDYPKQLRQVRWFDSSQGANHRYARTLEQAMHGLLPGPDEEAEPVIERPLGSPAGLAPAVLETEPGQELVVVDFSGRQTRSYPVEVWRLSDGRRIAVVSETFSAASLMNAAERIMAAVHRQWPNALILEHWLPSSTHGTVGKHGGYCWSSGTGGYRPADLADLFVHGLDLRGDVDGSDPVTLDLPRR
ncbi:hypothetical protein [Nocardia brasiliensis]|uniref:hypothetical protein n=1 Tax=Nocardia brasiliensis TaxID=37326 RepID=UPI0024580960|nr:hypothetical protein [Nocardia brasiliensis]